MGKFLIIITSTRPINSFVANAYHEKLAIKNKPLGTLKEISQHYQAFNKSKKLANSKAIFSGILLGGALIGAGTVGLAGFNFPGVIAGAIAGAAVAGITYFLLSRVGIKQKKKALDHTIQDKLAFFADTQKKANISPTQRTNDINSLLHTTEASDNELFNDLQHTKNTSDNKFFDDRLFSNETRKNIGLT